MAAKKTTTKKTTSQEQAPAKKVPAKSATKKAAPAPVKKAKQKKMSALDAADKVLAKAGEPMTTKQMIEQMAAKGYWSSPKGQTPSATLYAAITREIKVKGKDARFKKTDRGLFAVNN